MRIALLFTDGVGVGARDPAKNPLARGHYLLSQFDDGTGEALPGGGAVQRVDATFDLPGRPQSATNQTAILTGEPAPTLLGKHLLGFPNAALRELLAKKSIVKRLTDSGRTATFANAYPLAYLEALGLAHRPGPPDRVSIPPAALRRLRPSATTCAMAAGGVLLRTLADAQRGEALTNDVDGARARSRGLELPQRTAEEAARVFWRLAEGQDFTLFEHSLADDAGHAQDWEAAANALERFDGFARAAIAQRPADAQVLICSDHGNVEDLSIRNHTRNLVAVLSFGPFELPSLQSVADVGKAVLAGTGVAA